MYNYPGAAAWRLVLRCRGRNYRPASQIWPRRDLSISPGQGRIRKIIDERDVLSISAEQRRIGKIIDGRVVSRPVSETVKSSENLPVKIKTSSNGVSINDSANVDRKGYFEHLAIRDMCQCDKCVDPSTRQRQFSFADIPSDIRGRYNIREDGKLEVRWTKDIPGYDSNHVSVFALKDLLGERNRVSRGWNHLHLFHRSTWNARKLQDARQHLEFRYQKFIGQAESRDEAVHHLLRWGLIFIQGVPSSQNSVKKIMQRFGPIRNTFYGETWDVRSVPGAKNVAYTARDLGFHQDLLYMENPPGLQALHMIKASSTGGESLFTDAAYAVDELAQRSPEHIPSLFEFPVTYRYRNAGEWYEYSRPTLEGGAMYDISKDSTGMPYIKKSMRYGTSYNYINWSPPFQGPMAVNRGNERPPQDFQARYRGSPLQRYRRAAQGLRMLFEAPEAVYETRMEPGTCVVFNNRRILHARKAFPIGEEGGTEERWLRGAYGDLDPLMSRYRMAMSSSGDAMPIGANIEKGPFFDIAPRRKRANQQEQAGSTSKAPKVEESEITSFEVAA